MRLDGGPIRLAADGIPGPTRIRSGVKTALTLGVVILAVASCRRPDPLLQPSPARLLRPAPDSFDVRVESSRGPFVLRARRHWSPAGVDRLYYLVAHRYFDEARFFRVVPGFVAQWGMSGSPAINRAWDEKNIPDEPVRASNTRGRVAFARGGPNTRSVQLFVNLADNVRLDTLDTFGFPPIAEVISGMAAVDSLNSEYLRTRIDGRPGPSQDSIQVAGNGYLARSFPQLDWIIRARISADWQ